MHVRIARAAVAAAAALVPPIIEAASICRWVDENGRTHFADVVPDAYRKSSSCTDSTKHELSPEQRLEAQQRAAAMQARSSRNAVQPAGEQAPRSASAESAVSRPSAKRPAEVPTDKTDCQTWWRLYDESVECFGPYRTTRGAIKPEAFDKCNVINRPELKCGPRRN